MTIEHVILPANENAFSYSSVLPKATAASGAAASPAGPNVNPTVAPAYADDPEYRAYLEHRRKGLLTMPAQQQQQQPGYDAAQMYFSSAEKPLPPPRHKEQQVRMHTWAHANDPPRIPPLLSAQKVPPP